MPGLPFSSDQTKSIKVSVPANKGQDRSVHYPWMVREPLELQNIWSWKAPQGPPVVQRGKRMLRVSVM